MDCRDLETRLELLLDGSLTEAARQACLRHLAGCPACAELYGPAVAAEPASVDPPADLLASVLARTSGPGCGRAQEQLGDLIDGSLAPTDRELVAAHLDGCGECRALAAVLAALPGDLPPLAEIRPRPELVAAVLAATLPPHVRLRRWLAREWPRWVRRPRFAWEAAYVATIFTVLLFSIPGARLEALPQKALTVVRTNPVAELERPAAALEARAAAELSALWSEARTRAVAGAQGAAEAAVGLVGPTISAIGDAMGTIRSWLASLMEGEAEGPPNEPTDTTEETRR